MPREFLPENVAALSDDASRMTDAQWFASGEPFRSMHKDNPWLKPPVGGNGVPAMRPDGSLTARFRCPLFEAGRSAEGGGLNGTPYYDTTVSRKHNYWRQFDDMPRETKDINRARHDLQKYGFCLIEDAMSEGQCSYMRNRLEEQAEAERECGLADMSPHFHIMWTLVNKGDCFAKCIEFSPEWVQGGPLIEQLNNELLGRGHYAYSFASNIARPGSYPQTLHQDSGAIHPIQTPGAPILVNTVYIMQDVNEVNGGTLVIPTSHRLVSSVVPGGEVGPLPPAINVEAKSGTVMLMDGPAAARNRSQPHRRVALHHDQLQREAVVAPAGKLAANGRSGSARQRLRQAPAENGLPLVGPDRDSPTTRRRRPPAPCAWPWRPATTNVSANCVRRYRRTSRKRCRSTR